MPTVLITGSSRGLGLEFARQYAADNWDVIATCRAPGKAESLNALAAQHPNIRLEPLDVADDASSLALANRLQNTALDVLINCAGIVSGNEEPIWIKPGVKNQTFWTVMPDAWDRVLRVNTIAPLMVTRSLIPNLKMGKERKVIMISSRCGSIEHNIFHEYIAYSTSKAALNMAMRNTATTLQPENIIMVSLNPGFVKTDMGGPGADISPEASISGMRKVIEGLTMKQSGLFIRYNGELVPW
jgi:NAD(P)-dependent dehydrogenase (short-subunit alcohol dehydrogenase family)